MSITDMELYQKRREKKMKEENELIRSVRLRILEEKRKKCDDEDTLRYWTAQIEQTNEGNEPTQGQ